MRPWGLPRNMCGGMVWMLCVCCGSPATMARCGPGTIGWQELCVGTALELLSGCGFMCT
jgi:hypothetical protein